jgi:hypothetical protein
MSCCACVPRETTSVTFNYLAWIDSPETTHIMMVRSYIRVHIVTLDTSTTVCICDAINAIVSYTVHVYIPTVYRLWAHLIVSL